MRDECELLAILKYIVYETTKTNKNFRSITAYKFR